MLDLSFSSEEIKKTIWDIPQDKSPSLDGYNSTFYKATWSIVGTDVVKGIQNFFKNGKLLKSWNITGITLIPKVPCPSSLRDFRPISCCHVIYKCISKLICSRLNMFLNHIIAPNQGAFVGGRNIIHNVLLCQDIFKHYGRKGCSPRCLLKIDLQKAYDTLDWMFLKDIMVALNFPLKFISIVISCITSTQYSLILNGSPMEVIETKTKLRQGDPMSPLLFVLGMEYLSRILMKVSKAEGFKFHPRCKKLQLTHLAFADDLMIFCKGNLESIQIMKLRTRPIFLFL